MKTRIIAAFLTCIATLGAAEKPNVLMILVDDLGLKDLGLHGSTLHRTPHMDRLGREGMVFENARAAHPRCVPSRYGIFSGRIPGRDGVPGFEKWGDGKHVLPLARVTFAERVQEAGYATGYIGKWHLGREGGEPDKQGFDDSRIAGHAGAPNSYFYPFHVARKGKSKEHFPEVEGEEGEYLTDRLTEEATDFLRKNKASSTSSGQAKPFLLVLAHYAVHTPFEAPEDVTEKYRGILKKNGVAEGGTSTDDDFRTSGNATDKTAQNNPVYAAMVERTDDSVGAVLAELDNLGLADNTLVILTSDHGGLSTRSKDNQRPLATTNAPYRHGKGWLYDGGLRVPMLVKWPGMVKPGSRSDCQTLGVDHYPTILEAAGVELPAAGEIDGVSYLPVLRGDKQERGPMLFHSPRGRPQSTGDENATALIDGQWKIFEHHASGELELYDLAEDPGERKNLAAKRSFRMQKMTSMLETMKKEAGLQTGGSNPFDKRGKKEN